MNFDNFRALGDKIYTQYFSTDFDERHFPEICATELVSWAFADHLTMEEIAEFLSTTHLEQHPDNRFSNFPITVYNCPEFYIELLVWTTGTTAIHQHAFSGAFRVLVGSSLHSCYAFKSKRRISTRLLIGEVNYQGSTLLSIGNVCAIQSGSEGLVHALYHLDTPSITLVVRTHEEPWKRPQYALYPPSIALDNLGLDRDKRVNMLIRLLETSTSISEELVENIWRGQIATLDFPRLFKVCMTLQNQLGDAERRDQWFNMIEQHHGELVEHLRHCFASIQRQSSWHWQESIPKMPSYAFGGGLG